MNPVTIPLQTPVKTPRGMEAALTLRPMTAKDLRQGGYPFVIRPDGGTEIQAAAVANLIAALASVPQAVVDGLTPADFNACAMAIMGFFTPAASEATPTT